MQFAQRAKMIKNKAVVNEENTSDQYWKERYFREIANFNNLHRAQTEPISSGETSKNTGGCLRCGGSKSALLENHQEKLLRLDAKNLEQAHAEIKKLVLHLKQEREKREELEMAFEQKLLTLDKEYKNQAFDLKIKHGNWLKI